MYAIEMKEGTTGFDIERIKNLFKMRQINLSRQMKVKAGMVDISFVIDQVRGLCNIKKI